MPSGRSIRAASAFVEITLRDTKFTRGLNGVINKLRRSAAEINSIGRNLAAVGFSGLTAIAFPTRSFVTFENALLEVESLLLTTSKNAVKTAKDMALLEGTIRGLGRSTTFTATQVAGAAAELARAGSTAEDIDRLLQSTLNLARATSTDLPRATEIALGIVKGFGIEAKDAATNMDVLTVTAAASLQRLDDLGEGFKFIAADAKNAGVSFKEASAFLGILASAGIRGSNAGTQLRRIFKNLASDAGQSELDSLGVSVENVQGGFRSLQTILKEVFGGADVQKSAVKLSGVIDSLFGRGSTAGLILGRDNQKELKRFLVQLQDVEGASLRAAGVMDSGLGGSLRLIRSAFNDLEIEIGQQVSPIIKGLESTLKEFANRLQEVVKANGDLVRSFVKGSVALFASGTALLGIGFAMAAVQVPLRGLLVLLGGITGPILALTVAAETLLSPFVRFGIFAGKLAGILLSLPFLAVATGARILAGGLSLAAAGAARLLPILVGLGQALVRLSFLAVFSTITVFGLGLRKAASAVFLIIAPMTALLFKMLVSIQVLAGLTIRYGLLGAAQIKLAAITGLLSRTFSRLVGVAFVLNAALLKVVGGLLKLSIVASVTAAVGFLSRAMAFLAVVVLPIATAGFFLFVRALQKTALILAVFRGAALGLVAVLRGLSAVLLSTRLLMALLSVRTIVLATVTRALTSATALLRGGLLALRSVLIGFAVVTQVIAGGLVGLVTTFVSVIAPLALLAVGAVALISNWERIKGAVESVKAAFQSMLPTLQLLWRQFKLVFEGIVNALRAGEISLAFKILTNFIKVIWNKALLFVEERFGLGISFILTTLGVVGQAVSKAWKFISDTIISLWERAVKFVRDSANSIGKFFGASTGKMSGVWQENVNSMLDSFASFATGIKTIWRGVVDFFAKAFLQVGGFIDNLLKKGGLDPIFGLDDTNLQAALDALESGFQIDLKRFKEEAKTPFFDVDDAAIAAADRQADAMLELKEAEEELGRSLVLARAAAEELNRRKAEEEARKKQEEFDRFRDLALKKSLTGIAVGTFSSLGALQLGGTGGTRTERLQRSQLTELQELNRTQKEILRKREPLERAI